MSRNQQGNLPLGSYRVLDLTDEKGMLCGRILADLGAEVIKIERPGGDSARSIGPFYHDIPDPEKSLYWFAYNTNKKGITLNIETSDGQEIFKRLVEISDIVIESFDPGYMDSLGLGYSALGRKKPELIMTSITPFGQTGPYSHYKASDLALWSMGGFAYLTGDPDRPPVRITFPQAYFQGAAEGAVATMIALYHRVMTGEGQHADVSIQASVAKDLLNAPLFWEINRVILKRAGPYRVGLSTSSRTRTHWPCKDGDVAFVLFGGSMGARINKPLVEYMDSEGAAPQFMKELDWEKLDLATITQEDFDKFALHIGKFFMSHTKRELFEEATKRKITIYPVSSVEDIAKDPQLKARDFWQEMEHPELGATITYPGDFIKSTEPICCAQHRAPMIGEHNLEVYEKLLGLPREQLVLLKQASVI